VSVSIVVVVVVVYLTKLLLFLLSLGHGAKYNICIFVGRGNKERAGDFCKFSVCFVSFRNKFFFFLFFGCCWVCAVFVFFDFVRCSEAVAVLFVPRC